MELNIAGAVQSSPVYAACMTIDLEPVKIKMRQATNWSEEHLNEVEKQYRRFLFMCSVEPDLTVPSADIDLFWETHLADSREYAKDCKTVFGGGFLHHVPHALARVPSLTPEGLRARFASTLDRYETLFGEAMHGAEMSACDDCIPDYDPPNDPPDPNVGGGIRH
jgi:hypothetical protein